MERKQGNKEKGNKFYKARNRTNECTINLIMKISEVRYLEGCFNMSKSGWQIE
jgi:hypothetical protein